MSAARGCSPTERNRSPQGVLNMTTHAPISRTKLSQIIKFRSPKTGPMKYTSLSQPIVTSGIWGTFVGIPPAP